MTVRNFVLGLILIGLAIACQKEKPKDVVLNARPTAPEPVHTNEMPVLTIEQLDGSKVSLKEMTGRVLLICFNPDCDHCQREAKMISENKNVISGWEVYFISPEKMELIDKFSKDYDLGDPNIHFGRAEGVDVINALGPITTVPTFFVYENQKRVIRVEGEQTLPRLQEMLR